MKKKLKIIHEFEHTNWNPQIATRQSFHRIGAKRPPLALFPLNIFSTESRIQRGWMEYHKQVSERKEVVFRNPFGCFHQCSGNGDTLLEPSDCDAPKCPYYRAVKTNWGRCILIKEPHALVSANKHRNKSCWVHAGGFFSLRKYF